MKLNLFTSSGICNYILNEPLVNEGFKDSYTPDWVLDKTSTYTLAFDIGVNSMSLSIGFDNFKIPTYVLEFHKDEYEYNPTIFIDHLLMFVSGILSKNYDVIRTVFVESPVYYTAKKFSRTNSYAILKQIKDRLTNVFNNYKIPVLSKPAVVWKSTVLEPLRGTINLSKSNKEYVKGQVIKYYRSFLAKIYIYLSEDSYDSLGMLYYLYSFYTGNTEEIIITKNSPRLNKLNGSMYYIDTPDKIQEYIQSKENEGYKVCNFTYCNDLDIEENIKGLLAQSVKGCKVLYKCEISVTISTLKTLANFSSLSSIFPSSKFILVGGWI